MKTGKVVTPMSKMCLLLLLWKKKNKKIPNAAKSRWQSFFQRVCLHQAHSTWYYFQTLSMPAMLHLCHSWKQGATFEVGIQQLLPNPGMAGVKHSWELEEPQEGIGTSGYIKEKHIAAVHSFMPCLLHV